jgi:hypothetical protein
MRMTAAACASRRPAKVAVLVACCLIPITGMAALVFDLGALRDDRQRAVLAADAAALAGATDLYNNWNTNEGVDASGSAVQSATTTAAANGFSNSDNATVTVNVYPSNYQGGPHAGTQIPKGYVEVIITFQQDRFFGVIWGSDQLNGGARSVARGTYTPATPGILVLDPTDNNTFNLTSSGNVTVANGGAIVVDSTSADGGATLTGTGNATADTINLSGPKYNQSSSGDLVGTVSYNVPKTPDPLAALPEPGVPAYPTTPTNDGGNPLMWGYSISQGLNYSGNETIDLYPGYYEGIQVTGLGSVRLHDNPNGTPGIYYIGSNGLSITNGGGISGSNVMLYSAGTGSISLTGSGNLRLSPPTSGPYKGISIFQERSSNRDINVTGSGNMDVAGTLYAASAKVTLTGTGDYNNNFGSQWIAWQLAVTGSGSFTVNYNGNATPIRSIQLVE